ncbi:MAG TPA: hypothetical protein GX010_01855 [Erysipelotrichaceae bacterium]|nr:hypothetical protein [Erysipelotrichaceae bacterium]
MKRKRFLLPIIVALSLTSCVLINDNVTISEVPIYDIDLPLEIPDNQIADLEDYKIGTINAVFRTNERYVPYLSFEQYASLYDKRLAQGARSVVTKTGQITIWEIYVGEQLYFYTAISYLERLIVKAGEISNAFKAGDDPTEIKALSFAVSHQVSTIDVSEESYETYSFKDISLQRLYYKNDYYYPLGFLDLTYSETSSIFNFYNYYGIYETRDVENFSNKMFLFRNEIHNVDSQMSLYCRDIFMPSYLIKYNANMFLYTMDNFYGLKDYKGITSMKSFLIENNIYNDFFSINSFIRGSSYYTALGLLDDGHTAIISTNNVWGEKSSGSFFVGDHTRHRAEELRNLAIVRSEQAESPDFIEENGIRYSDSGQTALIIFDEFIFGKDKEVFNDDGSLKEDADQYDTYLKLVKSLKEIKTKGTVNNVVLDISLNGGGVLGVMMKVLALISKENNSNIHLYHEAGGYVISYTTSIDSNYDGVYEASDSFGNTFNFYIATSAYSFSAANALTFYANLNDYAKIIGRKSGGGECAISIHYLPNSQYVYHSSTLHIGYYDEKQSSFLGDEEGVEPDIYLENYNVFGDPNAIEEIISETTN